MEFEVLKRSHLKRNIIIGLFAVAIISAAVLNFTQAKYRVTQSIPLVNGKINYNPGDIIISAYYNDELLATFPTKDSEYAVENITCDNNTTATFDKDKWQINITNLVTKGTKCDVTFVEKELASESILAGKDIQERTDFSTTLTTNTNGIIYQEDTSDGTTYYFAGDTDENWVSFAGYYWRIIRINEDGSIRMIYNGTSTSATGGETRLQTSSFNYSNGNNAYAGYMCTLNSVHGTGTSSTIKGIVDNFYRDQIAGEYEDYISKEAGFCGDRTSTTTNGGAPNDTGGIGTTTTYYGARYRLDTNKTPTFECSDEANDLYTAQESSKGNHALTYPIGLITADEVAYAGGVWDTYNSSYYLYTRQSYWTMSPYNYSGGANVFLVSHNGDLGNWGVSNTVGVRPVLNLDAGVTLTGSGTTSDPYRVN